VSVLIKDCKFDYDLSRFGSESSHLHRNRCDQECKHGLYVIPESLCAGRDAKLAHLLRQRLVEVLRKEDCPFQQLMASFRYHKAFHVAFQKATVTHQVKYYRDLFLGTGSFAYQSDTVQLKFSVLSSSLSKEGPLGRLRNQRFTNFVRNRKSIDNKVRVACVWCPTVLKA
jgi:hypothetical protein